jgi:hypothetical protein
MNTEQKVGWFLGGVIATVFVWGMVADFGQATPGEARSTLSLIGGFLGAVALGWFAPLLQRLALRESGMPSLQRHVGNV